VQVSARNKNGEWGVCVKVINQAEQDFNRTKKRRKKFAMFLAD